MTLQAVAHLLRRECHFPVVAGAARLAFIVGLHGEVRRGADLGLKRLILAVTVQTLLTLCQVRVVIERHLSRTGVALLILGLLLEGEGRRDLRLCLSETTLAKDSAETASRA